MAIYYDLLQLNDQLIGIGLNNTRKLLETPSIVQGFSSYVAQIDADKQDRIPNNYYKQATEGYDPTQTYYVWGNVYNSLTDKYTFGFYQVSSPTQSDYNKGLYYVKITESIDSSVWLGYVQATGQYDPLGTYSTYSLVNGVGTFTQVAEPNQTDFNAGKYFVQRAYGTDEKTIVNAINDLAERLNLDQIDLDGRVSQLRTEVNTLEQQIVIQETPIGSIETKDLTSQDIYENQSDPDDPRNGLPTDAYLDSYVYSEKSRLPENGDVIFVTENIPTETDEIYKFIFSGNTWLFYQIPGVQSATNDAKGIIKGTYVANFTGLTDPVIVDIEDGEIANIYIKTASSYKALKTYIDEDSGKIDNILINNVLQSISTVTVGVDTYYKAVNIQLKTINGTAVEGTGDITISIPVKAVALGSLDLTPDINGKVTIPTTTPDLVPFVDMDNFTDTTPASGSDNFITSGGVYTALSSKANNSVVAETYNSTLTYAVGDLVMYEGVLYRCSTAITTAEAWDSTHWTQKDVSDLISALQNGKLDKDTTATYYRKAYMKYADGTQGLWDMADAVVGEAIPLRNVSGQITVPNTPTSDGHATSKKYVDDGFQAKVVVNTTATSPITLANNTSFRLGTISALTINNPSEYSLDFECEVIFTADTGISMTYSAVSPTWSGDDVSGGVFTPVDGKTYNILFFNNATAVATPSVQAIVRGV